MHWMAIDLTARAPLFEWERHIERIHDAEAQDRDFQRVKSFARHLELLKVAPKVVIVGGTNGKGTVVHFVEQLLLRQGMSVGSTYSPHLHRVNERVSINGSQISDECLTGALAEIVNFASRPALTYFDILTLSALHLFQNHNLDVVLLEVGLGGRLDASNVVIPDVSVITNVSLDHQEILGRDREAIGYEKAGILRDRTPVVFGETSIPVSVRKRADQLNCPIKFPLKGSGVHEPGHLSRFQKDEGYGTSVNYAIACEVAHLLVKQDRWTDVPATELRNLPGRLEIYERDGCTWLLDVSHNEASVTYLEQFIKRHFPRFSINTVFACRRGKNYQAMLKLIEGFSDQTIITEIRGKLGLQFNDLDRSLGDKLSYVPNARDVFENLQSQPFRRKLYVACGSFALVEEIRELLCEDNEENREFR